MQIQADLLGTPLLRPVQRESTAYGAAMLAALGAGLFPDRASLAQAWQVERRFAPGGAADATAATRRRWQRAVARARAWAVDDPPCT